jgi:hypothetical protein
LSVLASILKHLKNVGEPLDLGDAIRLFHDSLDYPYVVSWFIFCVLINLFVLLKSPFVGFRLS